MKLFVIIALYCTVNFSLKAQSVEISAQKGQVELNNASLKFSGNSKTAFIHTVNPGLLDGGFVSIIDNEICNSNYDLFLMVTQYIGNTESFIYNNSPVGVFYDSLLGKWKLINLNFCELPTGAKFFIMAIKI